MKRLSFCVAMACALAIASPSLASLMESTRLEAASGNLRFGLEFAHARALQDNTAVVVCKSIDGEACTDGGAWDQGWIVFEDRNGNGARDRDERLLLASARLAANLRVRGNVRAVAFTSGGTARLVGATGRWATLTVCNELSAPAEARQIRISAAGGVSVAPAPAARCSA
jgi:type IV fimbrial biogenesis protein FimT